MKRAMWTLAVAAVVVLASFGAVSACGDEAKAKLAAAKADGKDCCAKGPEDCPKSGCAKGAALVAKADGAAAPVLAVETAGAKPCGAVAAVPAVEIAGAKPCAGAAETAGCAKKSKAADVAKADAAKPVEIAESAK